MITRSRATRVRTPSSHHCSLITTIPVIRESREYNDTILCACECPRRRPKVEVATPLSVHSSAKVTSLSGFYGLSVCKCNTDFVNQSRPHSLRGQSFPDRPGQPRLFKCSVISITSRSLSGRIDIHRFASVHKSFRLFLSSLHCARFSCGLAYRVWFAQCTWMHVSKFVE